MPRHSLSELGLGAPEKEREDKDTQDGIKPPAHLAKLRSFSKTAKFSSERRLRICAKSPLRDFSPASASSRITFVLYCENGYIIANLKVFAKRRQRHFGTCGDRPRGSRDFIGFYRSPPSRAAKMATLPVRATALQLTDSCRRQP